MKNKRVGGRRSQQSHLQLGDEAGLDIWQRLTRVLLGVLLLGVVVFVLSQFVPEVDKQKTVDAELASLTARRDSLARERDLQKANLEYIRTDQEYFEVFARDKLDLRREGETIYRIERPDGGALRAIEVTE
jgi:cell division protein FtsB